MGCSPSKSAAVGTVSHIREAEKILDEKSFRNEYEVQAELGSGAHSVVKLAYHRSSKTQRAVKIIQSKNLPEEDISSIDKEIGKMIVVDAHYNTFFDLLTSLTPIYYLEYWNRRIENAEAPKHNRTPRGF